MAHEIGRLWGRSGRYEYERVVGLWWGRTLMSLARACAVVFAAKDCLWDFALLLVGYSVRFCGHCFRNVILFFSF